MKIQRKTENTNRTEKLINIIRSAYKPPTTGHVRDLIEACETFLNELEEDEYMKHRARYLSQVSYIFGN